MIVEAVLISNGFSLFFQKVNVCKTKCPSNKNDIFFDSTFLLLMTVTGPKFNLRYGINDRYSAFIGCFIFQCILSHGLAENDQT